MLKPSYASRTQILHDLSVQASTVSDSTPYLIASLTYTNTAPILTIIQLEAHIQRLGPP
jgi:hypothetical protein